MHIWKHEQFEVSDDLARVDFDFAERMLRASYWAADRSRDVIERSWRASVPFSMWDGPRMIGMARAVTDRLTFSWIADVVIDPDYRGRQLGRFLMRCVIEHPDVRDTKIMLGTRDAHAFYEKVGFERRQVMRKLPKAAHGAANASETE